MENDLKKVELSAVYSELLLMKKIMLSLKNDFEDKFLSAEEEVELNKAREEYSLGECVSLEDLKKKRNV